MYRAVWERLLVENVGGAVEEMTYPRGLTADFLKCSLSAVCVLWRTFITKG